MKSSEKKMDLNHKWVLYAFAIPFVYATALGSLWISLPIVAAAFYVVWLLWQKLLGLPPAEKGQWSRLGYECSFWMAVVGIAIAVPMGLRELDDDHGYAAMAAIYTSLVWLAGSLIPYYASKPLDRLMERRR